MNGKQIDEHFNKLLSIPEWFSNKNIFITGGSGYIGKALIEKLLRSCPNIGNIFLLIRCKKGLNPNERIKKLTTATVFDRLKREQPNALSKLIPISGDVTEINLGLSEKERKLLIKMVHIIYHCAATVRFHEHLSEALKLNTRGTREMCLLALEMDKLQFFGHVSTAYSNANHVYVEEKLYHPVMDWRKAIKAAETMDPILLNVLTDKLIHPLPNTYTFTKHLAEFVVNDLLVGKINCCIFRPSIVIPSAKEPEPGWNDSFNGPPGLFLGFGTGVLRVCYTEPDVISDFIPIDILIKAIILATRQRCIDRDIVKENKEIAIYNLCNGKTIYLTNGQLCKVGLSLLFDYPPSRTMWFPNVQVTASKFNFYWIVFFYHIIPALIFDFVLLIIGRKPILFNIQKNVFNAHSMFKYFISRDWTFVNKNMVLLNEKLQSSDRKQFAYGIRSELMQPLVYYKNSIIGIKKILLKDDLNNIENDRKRIYRKWILHEVRINVSYLLIFWFLIFKLDIINIIWKRILYYFNLYFNNVF